MRTLQRYVIVSTLTMAIALGATASEKSEHQRVARRVLDSVLVDCGGNMDGFTRVLLRSMQFEELCSFLSDKDMSRARFHERDRTVLDQLATLGQPAVEKMLRECNVDAISLVDDGELLRRVQSVEQPGSNVVVNYLLPHLAALHCARAAGKDPAKQAEALRQAWVYEARAQSYLLDAFCAGHILAPMHDALYWLHGVNNAKAHHFYNSGEGAYVINSRKEVWQTFGDELLEWYAPTFSHALEACRTSLRELLLTYFVSKDQSQIPDRLRSWAGGNAKGSSPVALVEQWLSVEGARWYYESAMMPTLLLLPMPVSAVWSEKSERVDVDAIHERNFYPQLREAGLHDPDTDGIDMRFIYPEAGVPVWMRFTMSSSPEVSIRNDPNVASVRYIQQRDYPPSYEGLLTHLRVGHDFANGAKAFSFGAGYGILDEFLFLKNLSPDILLTRANGAWHLQATGGVTVSLPPMPGVRIEAGYLWGLGDASGSRGLTAGAGIESETLPFRFTYAGMTARLMYRFVTTSPWSHRVSLELVIQ